MNSPSSVLPGSNLLPWTLGEENHLSKGQKKSTRLVCLMLSRPSLTGYSIAADRNEVKTTLGRHLFSYEKRNQFSKVHTRPVIFKIERILPDTFWIIRFLFDRFTFQETGRRFFVLSHPLHPLSSHIASHILIILVKWWEEWLESNDMLTLKLIPAMVFS